MSGGIGPERAALVRAFGMMPRVSTEDHSDELARQRATWAAAQHLYEAGRSNDDSPPWDEVDAEVMINYHDLAAGMIETYRATMVASYRATHP
jgi:hypothetical protein